MALFLARVAIGSLIGGTFFVLALLLFIASWIGYAFIVAMFLGGAYVIGETLIPDLRGLEDPE